MNSEYSIPKIYTGGDDMTKRWFVSFSVPNQHVPGTNIRKKFYEGINQGETKAERHRLASQVCEKYTRLLEEGWRPKQSAPRKKEYVWKTEIESFLNEIKSTRSAKTYQQYKTQTTFFLNWLRDNTRSTEIPKFTLSHAENFRQYLLSLKKHPTTINGYVRTLKHIIDRVIDRYDLIIRNPFNKIKKLQANTGLKQRISETDLRKITDYLEIHDSNLLLFIRFVFSCFIRPYSELRFMKVSWINFEDETVTIPGDIAKKIKKTLTVQIPKGKLLSQIQYLKDYNRNSYVFTVSGIPGKNHVGSETFRVRFNNIRDHLRLNKSYTIYGFKHTGASMLVKAGVNVKDIQLQMRHHSLEMTDKYLTSMLAVESEDVKNLSYDL